MKTFSGLIMAMPMEARWVLGRRKWQRVDGWLVSRASRPGHPDILCVCSGMGAANAEAASRWLLDQGATGLGGLGVAGGLHPSLSPGDLIVADSVIEEQDGKPGHVWFTDQRYARQSCTILTASGLPVRLGRIMAARHVVLSRRDKENYYRQSRALAVDLESAAITRVAWEAGLPSFVMRSICDPAEQSLPAAVINSVAGDGRVRLLSLLHSILGKPSNLVLLWQLKREVGRALTSLGQGWQLVSAHQ